MFIRDARLSDAEELLKIYAPYVTDTAVSFEYDVPTLDEFKRRIVTFSEKYPYLVAEENGELLGYTYAHPFISRRAYDYSCEVTVYIRQDMRKKGIGSSLYQELEKRLMKMNIKNINACIAKTDVPDEHLSNASPEFHKKMGYTLVGTFHSSGYKFNKWYDMIWMEKIIGSHESNEKPINWEENKNV